MQTNSTGGRIFSLDILRGIAALSVVLWHWQGFFYQGYEPGPIDHAALPLSGVFSILYLKGNKAVDLFFCLSGFIFYWLYSERVAKHRISPGQFAVLRLSRLYPLHLATLLIVGMAQALTMYRRGSYFVYPYNDARHFILQLFFASSWGLQLGGSFNGPIWSVSVEILLYGLFFACCRLLPLRPLTAAILVAVGLVFERNIDAGIGRGITSFFTGACAYYACRAIASSPRAATGTAAISVFAVAAWTFTLALHGAGVDLTGLHPGTGPLSDPACAYAIKAATALWPILVLFPATVLALALVEIRRGTLGRRIAVIGDLSYASYLLCFPLQLGFAAAAAALGLANAVFYKPATMALFFACLIVLSYCSHRYFEIPAQNWIRKKWPGGQTGPSR